MLGRLAVSLGVSILVIVGLCAGRIAFADDVPPVPPEPSPAPAPDASPDAGVPAEGEAPIIITPPTPGTGPTIITGRVTDILGRPVGSARVYVLPRRGQPIQSKTDKDGRYSVQVSTLGTHGVVIAIDKAHTFRTMIVQQGVTNNLDIDVELDTQGGEVIKIEDRKRPAPKVKAKPTKDPRLSLPYSDEAVERDAWARAWLLLDVDEQGRVTRLKLLKRPGFDLDRICIEEALKLKFDPALDDQGRPMKTYMLWTMEWPSWGWLVRGNGTAVRRPRDSNEMHVQAQNIRDHGLARANWARPSAAATAFEGALDRVPCAGSGPLNLDLQNRAYRDCSEPDLSVAESLPWITLQTAATAIAELENPNLMLVTTEEGDRGSPWPGYIGAGVTGVLAIAAVYGYYQWNNWQDKVEDAAWQATVSPKDYAHTTERRDTWGRRALLLTGATIVTAGATLLLWNRNAPKSSFSVQPTESHKTSAVNGATAVFTMEF